MKYCLIFLLVCAAGCSKSSDGPDPREELLESWWEGFLRVELDGLVDEAEGLEAATGALCDAPTESSLGEARDAWSATHRRLKRQEIFNFGPYTEPPRRYSVRLDFWPARPDTVETTVANEDLELAPEVVGGLGGGAKGLPAAQVLLWDGGGQSETALAALEASERRCAYLHAITGNVADESRGLREAWDPDAGGHFGQLLEPGGDSEYESLVLSVSAVINRLWFAVENIRTTKLGKPHGSTSGGTPQPELAEARFARRSLAAIGDNLDAIELLYFGDDERSLTGVAEFVAEGDPAVNDDVRTHLEASRDALDEIDGPLVEAVESDSADVQAAIDALQELQRVIEVDVISTLGLSLSFNDNDGD